MQTPIPAQIEQWIKTLTDKKSPYDLKNTARLHLVNVRDIIDKSLGNTMKKQGQKNYESLFTR